MHEDQIVILYELFSRGKTILLIDKTPPTVVVCEFPVDSIKKS